MLFQAIAKGSVLGNPDLQLWSKSQVHSLIGDLMSMCSHTDSSPAPGSPDEAAVDRFAQIAQISMSMRILNCSKSKHLMRNASGILLCFIIFA